MDLSAQYWWARLTEEEQNVLIQMLYEMGDFSDYGVIIKDEKYVDVSEESEV